jgi:hypothetical protein
VEPDDRPSATVRRLLDEQLLAVLGTHHNGAPYTSLVAFAATEDRLTVDGFLGIVTIG